VAQTAGTVRRTYYILTAGNTLAASLIWGINTILLLDAGLSNFEAFAANAFYTAGMMLFEIPTGIVADSRGRRISFLWGTVTLAVATALYVLLWELDSPFVWWALVSLMLGLGYTFFSGATEAWLVDALTATKFDGMLEAVFARGQVVSGAFMLLGSVAGGYLAQLTNLGVPYVVRAAILLLMFVVALLLMRDLGSTPERGKTVGAEIRTIVDNSVQYGLKVPAIRATMLSGFFLGGIGVYIFYALQPYLLELWGNPEAYAIAGLSAAIVAGAQIVGGLITPLVRRRFRRRTSVMILMTAISVVLMAAVGLAANFWVVVAMLALWGLADAAAEPVRRSYLNGMIPSQQRATILSFDSLISSAGGIVAQPALGRVADVYGYRTSYLWSAIGSALALPFLLRARAANARADEETTAPPEEVGKASATQIDA
jgi:MFS family permease